MKRNLKIGLYSLGVISTVLAPIVATVSCGSNQKNKVLTIAVNPYANANFIKYLQAGSIAGTITQPLVEAMPPEDIKTRQQITKLLISTENGVYSNGNLRYGLIEPSSTGDTVRLSNGGTKLTISLRKDAKWENGDQVTAHDFVNTMHYIMNLNVGSELEFYAERYGILNAKEAYDEQKAYSVSGKVSIDDPFSEKSPLTACRNLGVRAVDDYTLEIKFNKSYTSEISSILSEPIFWPTNKKFIDLIGGIDKFGLTKSTMIGNGAYKLQNIDFDYGADLVSSSTYWNKDQVYLDKLRLRFIADQNLQSALFADHGIVNAIVPINFVRNYWSDPELRKYLKRGQGLGTLSILTNSNPSRSNSWLLQDPNFKKALMYGINRKRLMDLLGMEFSVPVGVLTARTMNLARDGEGRDVLEYLTNHEYSVPLDSGVTPSKDNHEVTNGKATFNLSILDYLMRMNSYQFENIPRQDTIYDENVAAMFTKRLFESDNWKQHAGSGKIVVQYAYDTANKQMEKATISLKESFNEIFGSKVELELKPYPSSTFSANFASGDWDVVYKQLDPISGNPGDYVGMFVEEDNVDPSIGKRNGYFTNPTGYSTYEKYFAQLKTLGTEESTREALGISKIVWDFTKSIVTSEILPNQIATKMQAGEYGDVKKEVADITLKRDQKQIEVSKATDATIKAKLDKELQDLNVQVDRKTSELKLLDEINSYIKWFEVHKGDNYSQGPTIKDRFDYFENTMNRFVTFNTIYPALELILRDYAPVIPIAEADNTWSATTMTGQGFDKRGWIINPEFGYDVLNKPYADLPGEEILSP